MEAARLTARALVWIGLLAVAPPAAAQIVEVPEFEVSAAAFAEKVSYGDVAVATDGTIVFLWGEYTPGGGAERAGTRWFSADGLPLAPAVRADTSGHVREVAIDSDTRGGYIGAWFWVISGQDYSIFGRRFDGAGVPVGPEFEADLGNGAAGPHPAVAGLPSGSVFVWSQSGFWGRLYDPAGVPRGAPFRIGATGYFADVAALPDGGFVTTWYDFTDGSWIRAYGADGQPRGDAVAVSDRFVTRRMSVSPTAGVAVVGTTLDETGERIEIWARRFGHDAQPLGAPLLVYTGGPGSNAEPDIVLDLEGNLYVAWGEVTEDAGYLRPQARGFDASERPLGPAFWIGDSRATTVHVARLPNGNLVNTWNAAGTLVASIVSLCTPGVAVCGDGVVVSQCEECDDGIANSDILPGACRMDCRRARCGDGVLDGGEECDAGSTGNGEWDAQGGTCCSPSCVVEPDTDADGVCDPGDACPSFWDPEQTGPGACRPAPLERLSDPERQRFEAGLAAFSEIETAATGLGPVFNDASCAACHRHPMVGGSSNRLVTLFGRATPAGFDPMTDAGGMVLQAQGLDTATCAVAGEVVPAEANVVAQRNAPALFGIGLVDAIADERILKYADPTDRNGDGVSGRANLVGGRVGRFGWKAQQASLAEFAADAYLLEMGITSSARPTEEAPQGHLPTCDSVPDPEDDGDVAAFTDFMILLAPLPPGPRTVEARRGKTLFRRARCSACHLDKLRTGAASILALRNRRVHAFSDFLLHDMGPDLADGIEQAGAGASEFRTAPLWGVGQSAPYLHDGRAATLGEAIAAHGGEAAAARDRFLALTPPERDAMIAYLGSL